MRAENGHIYVKGRVDHEALEDQVQKLVKNVPGVTAVTTHVYAVPPETIGI